ncbi:hypothetical protein P280DRAFT_523581 [Massarina eburnea CBS 473.64]|uniref:Uncharacterized protein n=1 Tax=Massarina eburnea CBS 473.64 TaxID=1395130 RepID=A0A6A6RI35_9PLEO|nr:hypothetical protein P280DRAFT_523581 [Massarina eburnea CBS 473.64]
MPRLPYVVEGIPIRPTEEETTALSRLGYRQFIDLYPPEVARKRKHRAEDVEWGNTAEEKRTRHKSVEEKQRIARLSGLRIEDMKMITELKAQNKDLETRNQRLEDLNRQLEHRVQTLEQEQERKRKREREQDVEDELLTEKSLKKSKKHKKGESKRRSSHLKHEGSDE